jgi:hypothetical protein
MHVCYAEADVRTEGTAPVDLEKRRTFATPLI